MQLKAGDLVYALNLKYTNGTRLRVKPEEYSSFGEGWVPNNDQVLVIEVQSDFVKVENSKKMQGWIRTKNLTNQPHVEPAAETGSVTHDAKCIGNVRYYNIGLEQDPVPGSKTAKGAQHLISPIWTDAMAQFASRNYAYLKKFVAQAQKQSDMFLFFINASRELYNKSLVGGLKSPNSVEQLLMATWLLMAAAESDRFPFSKYTDLQRAQLKAEFFKKFDAEYQSDSANGEMGIFDAPASRYDLLPPVALERFAISNELSLIKYKDPEQEIRDGFPLTKRVNSLLRHYLSVLRGQTNEDHISNGLFCAHAIYCNLVLHPDKNDITDFQMYMNSKFQYHHPAAGYKPTTSLDKIDQSGVANAFKLDWNEGTIPPSPSAIKAIEQFTDRQDRLNWYPHLAGGEMTRQAIAQYCQVSNENVMITNGSDDALILLCRAFLNQSKSVLIPVPTYEHFVVNSECTGAKVIRFQQKDPFKTDIKEIDAALELHRPNVIYLVSPNNPTGAEWSSTDVEALAKKYTNTLFVVDEAYHEFGHGTCMTLPAIYNNVVVTRTASKAFCLASLRIGWLVAAMSVIEVLTVYYNPKSVNELAQVALCGALADYDQYYKPYIHKVNANRTKMVEELNKAGLKTESGGGGNFVCIKMPEKITMKEFVGKLEEKNIYIRNINERFQGYVRITIGEDVDPIIKAVKEIMGL